MNFAKILNQWFGGRNSSDSGKRPCRESRLKTDPVTSESGSQPRREAHFKSDAEVRRYVDEQLTKGLPPGWSYRGGEGCLAWHIEPCVPPAGFAGIVDYILEVSGDYRFFILYYGNTDAGVSVCRPMTALVMTCDHLPFCSLREAFVEVIKHQRPNEWGLT